MQYPSRKRVNRKITPNSDDEEYLKIIVEYCNEHKMKINSERIYDYETKKNGKFPFPLENKLQSQFQEKEIYRNPNNHYAKFPPGKDKVIFIIKKWIEDGNVTDKKKNIIFKENPAEKLIRRKWGKYVMNQIESQISDLENYNKDKKKFTEFEFRKFHALQNAIYKLPSSYQQKNNKEAKNLKNQIFHIQMRWLETQINHLEKIRKKQLSLWKKKEQKIFNLIDERIKIIISTGLVGDDKLTPTNDISLNHLQKEIKELFTKIN